MIFKIELMESEAQPVLALRTRTSLENLPKIIGETYSQIFGYLNELGQQPADAPYTAYYNLDMKDLDVEMGFPVAKEFPAKGDIKPGQIPAGTFVACIYKGPYSGMEAPYKEIAKWIEERGYQQTGTCYEYYFNCPADVPESELLTKIAIPVRKR